MTYFYVKALHIIFIVTWFSGMFYLVRLFVYNREAQDKPEPERTALQDQFQIMCRRLLFGITLPSAVLTLIFGVWMLILYPGIPAWLWMKIGLVFLLYLYHGSLHLIYHRQKHGIFQLSSQQLRWWNEVPTLFLVSIVMLVVVKQSISLVYALGGVIALILIVFGVIRIVKKG